MPKWAGGGEESTPGVACGRELGGGDGEDLVVFIRVLWVVVRVC